MTTRRDWLIGVGRFGLLSAAASVPRSLRAQPAGGSEFNVGSFGAVGDGVHDDTAAFEAALGAARRAGGGVVRIPSGVFALREMGNSNAAIDLTGFRNLWLVGAGVGATVVRSFATDGAAPHMVNVQSARHVKVSDMTVDGALPRGETGHNLRIASSSDIFVSDLELVNARYYGLHIGGALHSREGGAERIWISRVRISGAGRDCLDIKNPSGTNRDIFLDGLVLERPGLTANPEANEIDACLDVRGEVNATNIVCFPRSADAFGIRIRGSGQAGAEDGRSYAQLSHFRVEGEGPRTGRAGALLLVEGVCADVSHGRVYRGGRDGVTVRGRRSAVTSVQSSGHGGVGFWIREDAAATRVTSCLIANCGTGLKVDAPACAITGTEALNCAGAGFSFGRGAERGHVIGWRSTGNAEAVRDDSASTTWVPEVSAGDVTG